MLCALFRYRPQYVTRELCVEINSYALGLASVLLALGQHLIDLIVKSLVLIDCTIC